VREAMVTASVSPDGEARRVSPVSARAFGRSTATRVDGPPTGSIVRIRVIEARPPVQRMTV
jgi:hypothetical protein